LGADDDGTRSARNLAFQILCPFLVCPGFLVFSLGQPTSSSSVSPVRSTGVTGWIVETACL
jgi:hypothetical protein